MSTGSDGGGTGSDGVSHALVGGSAGSSTCFVRRSRIEMERGFEDLKFERGVREWTNASPLQT